MQIWPAIDLLGGAAVRLHQGSYDAVTVFDRDPLAVAARWKGKSPRLHVVDLEGARSGALSQIENVRALVTAFGGEVQVGGGIRTLEAIEAYVAAGARRIVLGTAAVKDPELLRRAARAHPTTIVVAVDAKDGKVATDGWLEVSTVTPSELVARYADLPLAGVLYTDVSRDGTRVGPNVEATAALAKASPFPVLASGGVGSLDHVRSLAAEGTIAGVVVGRALLDGAFTIDDARAAAGDRLRPAGPLPASQSSLAKKKSFSGT